MEPARPGPDHRRAPRPHHVHPHRHEPPDHPHPPARPGQTLDDLFDHYEALLDAHVAVGASNTEEGARTIAALGELYLADLKDRGRSGDYIAGRRCIIGKWITPLIGAVLVENWDTTHSTKVIQAARAGVGGARVEDIGSTLSGMRTTLGGRRFHTGPPQ